MPAPASPWPPPAQPLPEAELSLSPGGFAEQTGTEPPGGAGEGGPEPLGQKGGRRGSPGGCGAGGGSARSPAVPGCAGSRPAALPTPAGSRRPRRRRPWRRQRGRRPAGKSTGGGEAPRLPEAPPGTGPGAAAVFRARPEPGEAGPAPGGGEPGGGGGTAAGLRPLPAAPGARPPPSRPLCSGGSRCPRVGVWGLSPGAPGGNGRGPGRGAPSPATPGAGGGRGRARSGAGGAPGGALRAPHEPRGDKFLARSAGRAREGFCGGFYFVVPMEGVTALQTEGQHGRRGPVAAPAPRNWLPGKAGRRVRGGEREAGSGSGSGACQGLQRHLRNGGAPETGRFCLRLPELEPGAAKPQICLFRENADFPVAGAGSRPDNVVTNPLAYKGDEQC